MALDARGNPRISYYDVTNGDLKYASKTGGAWTEETVDTAGNVGEFCSLALDPEGDPHISYYDRTNADLKYAYKSGGAWTVVGLEGVDAVGQYTSLAIDAQGNPRICYYEEANGDLRYASRSGGVWTPELVDAVGFVGKYASLKLDGQGNPHVAYWDETNTNLKYARKSGGSWVVEVVDSSDSASDGEYCSLALNAQGNPAISYLKRGLSQLWFASKSGGSWSTEYAYLGGPAYTSLSLDAAGNPRICCGTLSSPGGVRYVTRIGIYWAVQWVEYFGTSSTNHAQYISMTLDSDGNPRISYFDEQNGDLRYADLGAQVLSPVGGELWPAGSRQTVTWVGLGAVSISLSADGGASYTVIEPYAAGEKATINVPSWTAPDARLRLTLLADSNFVSDSPGTFQIAPDLVSPWWTRIADATGYTGNYPSLALDAHGSPRVSYQDVNNGDLRYATRNGAVWTTETVDAAGSVGQYTSLALSAQGEPRISYRDHTNADLKYAAKNGASWVLETVDAAGDVGQHISLALDALGNPRIGYYAATNLDLKYASKSGGVWTLETVQSAGNVGEYGSLRLDALGNPRISYYDATNGDLRYAAKSGASWTLETVDSAGNVGQFTSLALDAQGAPRVSYYDVTNGDLKYAEKFGASWMVTRIDVAGNVGQYTALALDSQGEPWIAYRDGTVNGSGDLKVARRAGGVWRIETVDTSGDVGISSSLALDAQGNPRIAHWELLSGDLKYTSSALELGDPSPGATWPVGASRLVTWNGQGRADLSLSVDAGRTWDLLASGLTGGEYRDLVPHAPTRFAQYRLERAVPHSVSESGLFTIETSIQLLGFRAEPGPDEGVLLSWATDPGPDDLSGYTITRSSDGREGWQVLASGILETTYHDRSGSEGMHYRLSGTNGLGESLHLGETALAPREPLAAWPMPYRGGELNVSFLTASGLGGGKSPAEVAIFDLSGRLVRQLARGDYAAGHQVVRWDGKDESDRAVAGGIYFLRAESGGVMNHMKVMVLR
jgi:hypothetical protein